MLCRGGTDVSSSCVRDLHLLGTQRVIEERDLRTVVLGRSGRGTRSRKLRSLRNTGLCSSY